MNIIIFEVIQKYQSHRYSLLLQYIELQCLHWRYYLFRCSRLQLLNTVVIMTQGTVSLNSYI